jgi:hypothetical protein
MAQLSAVLIIPPIVGLVTYFVVRLFWKRNEFGIAARRKKSLSLDISDFAGAEKQLRGFDRVPPATTARSTPAETPSASRTTGASHQWGTVTLLTVGATGGFAIVWYLLNNQSLVVTLKHLAAF